MIKAKVVKQGDPRLYSCDNCGKENVPFFVMYELSGAPPNGPYATLRFCEDCSNELANAHYKTMDEYDELCKKKDMAHKGEKEATLETKGVLSELDFHVMTNDPPF